MFDNCLYKKNVITSPPPYLTRRIVHVFVIINTSFLCVNTETI